MTAAATAAKTSQALIGEPGNGRESALALCLVVGGGLVEGVALGTLQAVGLGRPLPGLNRRRWLLITVAVAGLGWAAASAPAALSGADDTGATPPLALILGGAFLLGAVMGTLLGAAQATVLRGQVRHPRRWVGASTAAWAPAVVVIFLGASAPDADWPGPTVIVLGALTGLGAGAILGLVSFWFLPTLDGPSAQNRLVIGVLGSRAHRVLDRPLVALRVRGVMTGRTFELPVQYAVDDTSVLNANDSSTVNTVGDAGVNSAVNSMGNAGVNSTVSSTGNAEVNSAGNAVGNTVVVLPGRPETKRWWRNLIEPAPVDVLLQGHWQHGHGILLHAGEPGYDTALGVYQRRWPRADIPKDSPLVRVRLDSLNPAEARTPPSRPAAE
jgi:MFS family permease